ncbi:protein of unknown function [Candidatus Filomicrobium marinum]|uniref:Uncharacterized protein n=2 Tax=Filomicrobium TaxID=119044 RepID=A0A0D6JI37_9HYPH|nr:MULTISPECIES: hypothetical protein [Filomicrobium]MCV0369314.1 hypothetical protein [Filomicrobium sp.]CFX39766.1 protein of unknown function [Candidatus Filomicrobium marinum]CPR21368.1 protein of unknown function [Candidatus Filomicrobium marinum]SDP27599.1 hypothetical protein SAMN04488061_2693 [Filomicrobium insigne]
MLNEVQQEVADLNGRIDALEDPREGYAMVKECIRRRREAGQTIPDDLRRLEAALLRDCLAQSQGR